MIRNVCISTLVLMMLLLSACSDLVSKDTLYGYDRGKKTFKLETELNIQKYPGEPSGFRYKSVNTWGVGNRNTRKTERLSWLNADYSLRRSEKTEYINQDVVHTEITRKADSIIIKKTAQNKLVVNKTILVNKPVYVDVLPQMFAHDLKQEGESRKYSVLDDRNQVITPIEVRFLGPQVLTEDGQKLDTHHFQIQAMGAPSEYDNYFIDPKSLEVLQISFGDIRFSRE